MSSSTSTPMVSSWVDLSSELPPRDASTPPRFLGGPTTPPTFLGGTTTPPWFCMRSLPSTPPHPLATSTYLKMLREAAQSPSSSAVLSSGTTSPKSPPNSPNVELVSEEENRLEGGFYINRVEGPGPEAIEEFLWDWSSLPYATPPKWLPGRLKPVKEEKAPYSGGTLASLLFSNLVSMIIGAGLGVWLYKRAGAERGLSILIA